MIVDKKVMEKLFRAFPYSFINRALEFIAHRKTNLWFRLDNCETEFDVKCKVLEWCSRDAYKAEPYRTAQKNREYNAEILLGINSFLGSSFSEEDIKKIYIKLGNAINHDLTVRFVESGYNISLLEA